MYILICTCSHRCCEKIRKFSRVISIVMLHCQCSRELIFEKFYLYSQMFRACHTVHELGNKLGVMEIQSANAQGLHSCVCGDESCQIRH